MLSNYFKWIETYKSATAESKGINNKPVSDEHMENVRFTAFRMDTVRALINRPILINSWFRCKSLNSAVGGSVSSQHLDGVAVDFKVNGMKPKQVMEIILKSGISFDQLIIYDSFIHISFKKTLKEERKQLITK